MARRVFQMGVINVEYITRLLDRRDVIRIETKSKRYDISATIKSGQVTIVDRTDELRAEKRLAKRKSIAREIATK